MLGKVFSSIWWFITAAKNATFNILFVLLIVAIAVGIFSVSAPQMPDTAALVIRPTGVIVEQRRPVDPIAKFLAPYDQDDSETLLKDILQAIHYAESDDRIKVLVLNLGSMQSAGFSQLEEIGRSLVQFKLSGKPIYAYARRYSQAQYYLASFADKIYLDKNNHQLLGGVFLTGLGVYPTYFKTALDKLKVNVHIYKVGKFKSAVEPLLRDDMSAEAKESNAAWLGGLWQHYTQTIIEQRGISIEAFTLYTDHYDARLQAAGSSSNQLALDENLVDELIDLSQWTERLKQIVGGEEDFNQVDQQAYIRLIEPPITTLSADMNKIAIVTAKGVIYDGQRPAGDIGGDSVSELIKEARNDVSVKAIVFRIDSPGGSAAASERIRTELLAAQSQGKPVVVSMGSYAASGGYWVSASANKIFAMETTITGSIGVFATLPTFEQTAAEFGIHSDGVGTTSLSSNFNLFKQMNPVLDSVIQQGVEHTYDHFLNIVAEGRDMTWESVNKIAQGRVWTAKAALVHGLIDAIGSETDAIASAALLAGVDNYEVLYMEKPLSTKEQLINEILNSQSNFASIISSLISEQVRSQIALPELDILKHFNKGLLPLLKPIEQPAIYAQCLACSMIN